MTISSTKVFRLLFVGLVSIITFGQSAHANLVTNPFFTGSTATATGWTSSATGPGAAFNHSVTATTGAARTTPPAVLTGKTEFYSGCNNASCLTFPFAAGTSSGAQQTITTVVGTAYTLSFWIYSSGTGTAGNPTEIDVYWGNSKVYAGANVTPAGWSLQTISLPAAAAASTNLTVLIRDNPDFSSITFMDVEPVVLRLAKNNPTSLSVGVPADYSLTVSNISTTTSGASFALQDQLPPNIAFNSAAAGTGITSVTGCGTSGVIATGLLVTCTVIVTGGIAPSGTGTLTLNVTPQAASAGIASVNKASVQYNGGVIGVAASASMSPNIATPSTCTGTDTGTGTPTFGCTVAGSITPTVAQLTFTKTVSLVCDPFNGVSNPKNIPGAVVQWKMTVANNGGVPVNLTTVSDLLSANTTFDSNLITGAGGAASCQSASGTPESATGKGFKLSIIGGTRPGPYPKFFTTVADADAASLSGSTVSINYTLGLPAEGTYTAGQLNVGESVVVYFNVTIN